MTVTHAETRWVMISYHDAQYVWLSSLSKLIKIVRNITQQWYIIYDLQHQSQESQNQIIIPPGTPPNVKKKQWFHLFWTLSSAAPCYKPWTLLYTPAAVPLAESPIPSSQSGHSSEVVGMEKKWRSTKLLNFDVCFKNQITNKTRFVCVYLCLPSQDEITRCEKKKV